MWLLDKFLQKAIKHGQLIVTDHDGKEYSYGPGGGEYDERVGGRPGPIRIRLTSKKAAAHIARYPQLGAGEAYYKLVMLDDASYAIFVTPSVLHAFEIEADSDSWMCSGMPSTIGVQKMPGAMVITRMPNRASSRAIGRVMPTIPPLEAE